MKKRLIIVPQLPIKMRYAEWWWSEIVLHMQGTFDDIVVLGSTEAVDANQEDFSTAELSVKNEAVQVRQYMDMDITEDDVLFHCDLSFPGIFHNVLFHKKPGHSVVFCHATSRNVHDIFSSRRIIKWPVERATAHLYDKVLVATQYHAEKLGLWNHVVMGALPHNPKAMYPILKRQRRRDIMFCSVSRPTDQKVTLEVESCLEEESGEVIERQTFDSWGDYYAFLDRCQFMVITAKEETYGYQVADAVSRGCCPIAPNAYSYPELLPDCLLYDNTDTPQNQAEQIYHIADNASIRCPQFLRCENAAQVFWENLKKELTT